MLMVNCATEGQDWLNFWREKYRLKDEATEATDSALAEESEDGKRILKMCVFSRLLSFLVATNADISSSSTAPPASWLQPTLVVAVGSGGETTSAGAGKGKSKSGQKTKDKGKEKDVDDSSLPKTTSVAGFSREVLSFNDIFPLVGMSVRAKEEAVAADDTSKDYTGKDDVDDADKEAEKGKGKDSKKLSKRQVRVVSICAPMNRPAVL